MNLRDALQKANQILDEERINPTVCYDTTTASPVLDALARLTLQSERGYHPRLVREKPDEFQFKSVNFDLLCTILDQVPDQDRSPLLASLASRILDASSYRHKFTEVLKAGLSKCSSSELPLLAELLVRRGEKQLFLRALSEAAPSPGLTLMLLQLEEMIALNFTLFTDEEYAQIPNVIGSVSRTIAAFKKRARSPDTITSNTSHHVCQEAPGLCSSVLEQSRKAAYLYVKGSLLPDMNLEVNHDKSRVRTFLE